MTKREQSVPETIGPYRVLNKIGKGGMGEVYLAEDSRLLRKVALKILPPEFTKEPDRLRRFQSEARAASALNHPNILTVHDIGSIEEVYFIATEYIDGVTLRTKLHSGKLTIKEAVEIAIQIVSALVAAHHSDIVHRDIKPENIMLRPDGYVKVLDFGLAKVTQPSGPADITEAQTITEAGLLIGTVKYMSPEQVRGLPVDARSDIFSLGVVLYEMIAGVTPFQGTTSSDFIAAILERTPPSLANYSPDVPPEIERITNKMLRKNKEERYQTATDLLNGLKNFKENLSSSFAVEAEKFAGTKKKIFSTGAPYFFYINPHNICHCFADGDRSLSI